MPGTPTPRTDLFSIVNISKERQETPLYLDLGDSDDDPELVSPPKVIKPSKPSQPRQPKQLSHPQQPSQSEPAEVIMVAYTVRVFLNILKTPGAKGQENERVCVLVTNFELNTEDITLQLTATQFLTFADPIQKEAQLWSVKNGLHLTDPKVQAIPKHASRMNKAERVKFNIPDHHAWLDIEHELLNFFNNNKIGLAVDLDYIYDRPTLTSSQLPPSSQSQGLAGHIGGRDASQASILTSGRHTTTQRMEQSVEDENASDPVQQGVEALGKRWYCLLERCSNGHGTHCWYTDDKPNTHYLLTPIDIKLWAAKIAKDNSGRITIDKPPQAIVDHLMKAQKSHNRNERRSASRNQLIAPSDQNLVREQASYGHVLQVGDFYQYQKWAKCQR